jgi:hypothetical protein
MTTPLARSVNLPILISQENQLLERAWFGIAFVWEVSSWKTACQGLALGIVLRN